METAAMMGRRLAARAAMPLADLGLSMRARVVLLVMANMARDDGDPPVYYGGWRRLAEAQGFLDYTPAAERLTARAIAELRKHGVIEAAGEPAPGVRVDYIIRL